MIKVLFVCLGNICRSPTAHGVFEHKIKQRALNGDIHVDSAGTAAWHIGKAPDARSIAAAQNRGYQLNHLRARQVVKVDFDGFDYILAMDADNLSALQAIAPTQSHCELGLLLPYAKSLRITEVPDPYYGGEQGFEDVLDMISDACDALLDHIVKQHKL